MVHIFNSDTAHGGNWTKDKEMLLICNIPPRVYHSAILISKDPLYWKNKKNVAKYKTILSTDTLAYNLNRDPEFYNKEANIIAILQEVGLCPTMEQILNKEI